MAAKSAISSLAELRAYAEPRCGWGKLFSEKTLAEKAWTNILNQCDNHERLALKNIADTSEALKLTRHATQAGIYGNVQRRIIQGLSNATK